MKKLLKLKFDFENKPSYIDFGQPETPEEYEEMFKLRYDVYVKEKKYIPNTDKLEKNREERDEHDENQECHYFIAKYGDKIIGTARIIEVDPLPIKKDYFDFEDPDEFKNTSNKKIIEIGRLISRPKILNLENFPRRIIPLGLFLTMTKYGIEKKYEGGYGALKLYALKKFKKVGVPVRLIKDYELKYSSDDSNDPLKNFFTSDDPVVPMYFLNKELKRFFEVLEKVGFLKREEEKIYYIKNELNFFDRIYFKIKFLLFNF
jgi:N-acyl-L-homoserine lactone synthetase